MPDEKFIQLHNHSYYSILDGLSTIEDMVDTSKELGYKSIALTDHGTCAGLYAFQNECEKKEIKPILGMEAYITDDHTIKEKGTKTYHLVLLAKNETGYKNLIYLSSFGYIHGFYSKPRIDFNVLEKHKEGLIISSACCVGEIPDLLWAGNEQKAKEIIGKYKETFKDDFYIEIMSHVYNAQNKEQEEREKKLASQLYKIARSFGIKSVCTNDSHYAKRSDAEAQDVLLSIQTLDNIKNPDRFSFGSNDFYIKSYDEMALLYRKAPELLLNTVEISEKIGTGLIKKGVDLLPDFVLPEGFNSPEDYLKKLVTAGMEQRGLIKKTAYRKRVRYEMEVIIKCNYTRYFLILWDVINFAKSNKIRLGVGRGSAVGCLTLYCLGVTGLDPLKYGLLFERFLNPERVSPPDVDVDFDYNRRDEVYNYVIRKYGTEYCSQIGTYGTYKAKAVIRSTVKALDLGNDWDIYQENLKKNSSKKPEMTKKSLDLADRISKMIPFGPEVDIESTMKKSDEFKATMQKYPMLLRNAKILEGTISNAGVHPAGILVSKYPIIDLIPMRNSKGVICSQYEGPEVEELGLLKYDLLAIKNLTLLETCTKMIKERHGKDVDVDTIEPDDKKVFEMYNGVNGKNTMGLFQFESPGMQKLLRDIHVDTFGDLVVAVSLYRPGPLKAGVNSLYCNYKHKRQKIEYVHPRMGEILKDTYGIMCFDGKQKIYTKNGPINIEDITDNRVCYYKEKNKKIGNSRLDKGSFISGVKKVYEYKLSNGFSIKCTEDHLVRMFDSKYKSIEEIYKNNLTFPYVVPDRNSFKKSNFKPGDKICKKMYYLGESIGKTRNARKNKIPIEEMLGSREMALSFFAGYVDGHECISAREVFFTFVDDGLEDDVVFILWKLGYRTCKINNSRVFLSNYNAFFNEISPFMTVKKSCIPLEYNVIDSDFLCVVDKKYIGEKEVYDLSMNIEDHNFCVAPGMIVHNCYQEDVMKVAKELAGFTMGQADVLRKAIGKKKKELMKEQGEKFINGCIKNGIDRSIAKKLFEQIEFFGGYGFNKSHGCAYGFISYQDAYLKTYYPLEFMCALLSSEIENNDQNERLDEYIRTAKDMGIVCKKIDINKSGLIFKIEKGVNSKGEDFEYLRSPFSVLNGVGGKATQSIVNNQPFKDLEDFLRKTDGRVVNTRVFSALVESGCMEDAWGVSKDYLLKNFDEIKKKLEKEKKAKKKQEKDKEKQTESGSLFDEENFDYTGGEIKI